MALRIAEQAGSTDVGRQRDTNEDALLVSPPFFAVADGMGGAKAGEVASRLATDVFGDDDDGDETPERRLARIAHEANRRIYELASRDESRRGMGTTLTAAMVAGREVSIGHVGDSRAYRLRHGELEQLTRDHSLVAELERRGEITPEAAESHPQRSIITRALGPEPEVEVDTYTVPGRAGDVYLLCSDGLTSMISDDEVASVLRGSGTLEEGAQALVRSANQSGGKDNVTVVLFRLEDDGAEGVDEPAGAASEDTLAGQVSADQVQAAAPTPAPVATEAPPAPAPPRSPPPAPRRRARRGPLRGALLKALLALVLLGGVGAGLYALSRQAYFVGTNDAGLVTLYRGVPYELPFGVRLYREEYASGVPARAIPRSRRKRVLGHDWRSRGDAVDLVRQVERGRLEGEGGR
ncbi:MAG: Stp1/IreP family PP2C-type Ser/Thr phosphatase [Thermoleophilaceae bacterium]